jgi:hypothetical protein
MLTPYTPLCEEIKSQAAVHAFTYEQMQAAANALWALCFICDEKSSSLEPDEFQLMITAARAWVKEAEPVLQTVHDAFVNCTKSLEMSHKQGG